MSLEKQLQNAFKQIQTAITDSLEDEVKLEGIKTMQNKVETVVVNAYTPRWYQRTGKLKEECKGEMESVNILKLYNDRHDETTGKYIVPIIETGKGYFNTTLDDEIGPRPFIQATKESLQDGSVKSAMKEGLQKRLGKNAVF